MGGEGWQWLSATTHKTSGSVFYAGSQTTGEEVLKSYIICKRGGLHVSHWYSKILVVLFSGNRSGRESRRWCWYVEEETYVRKAWFGSHVSQISAKSVWEGMIEAGWGLVSGNSDRWQRPSPRGCNPFWWGEKSWFLWCIHDLGILVWQRWRRRIRKARPKVGREREKDKGG